ncbi:galactokinase [Capnocytophaga sp. 051621]|uniref:Galactokinase n=3 Tax=Capnocytophaga TaxID=1016 RepID=A0AA46WCC8_CAPOC|nr:MULTISPECIES: galactokinase [Capnocytophaga]EIW90968.1 galactokinase [Capnocytophaga sp. oral taxon 412 str. F0487]EKY11447.1 galactokinase [Capnocytophaga sp. oral taxon 324 str. F0483]MBI1647941.1 galactokinase [Capnocytophaga periodontitidis]MBM0651786.1 galactokinase [Capnocytophaga genosp. AHN8471]MBM0660640.1 galactokinase [Capnocytophaga genosp. AHN8471]
MKHLEQKFQEVFGAPAEKQFFAPGRVNLIGEHTDYNGGNVFPCAIDKGTYGLVKKRNDRKFRMYSENFADLGVMEFTLDELTNDKKHDWANYPKGVIKMFLEAGQKIDSGFDILFSGNIPNGAGLSSSASIEMLTAIVLKDLFHLSIDSVEMAQLGKKTENLFIGVNSGIMDQFAIAMGKKDHAILLDCNTLKYAYVPVVLKDEVIVIANTNKRRGLADSKYNERRAECDEALAELQTKLPIKALGELSIEQFEANKDLIKSPVRQKRAKHAVYENQRTLKAQKELSAGNLAEFGKLMNQSHISLRDDYEVTGVELDTLAALAWEQPGVVGSRMTGAGFGGCTVSIVKKDKVDDFIKNVGEAYKNKIGYAADFYIASVSDGAKKL